MLTDTIVEEEFELKEEEPWYDKQDLEHGTIPLCLCIHEEASFNIQMAAVRMFWQ